MFALRLILSEQVLNFNASCFYFCLNLYWGKQKLKEDFIGFGTILVWQITASVFIQWPEYSSTVSDEGKYFPEILSIWWARYVLHCYEIHWCPMSLTNF